MKATTTRHKRAKRAEGSETSGGKSPRVIRKYPNRRLYDTVESRYVTLADIRRLVVERIDFVVLDRKTQQDITRSILLQVIAEQEGGGTESLMSRDFLSQVIRSYGSGLHDFVGSLSRRKHPVVRDASSATCAIASRTSSASIRSKP